MEMVSKGPRLATWPDGRSSIQRREERGARIYRAAYYGTRLENTIYEGVSRLIRNDSTGARAGRKYLSKNTRVRKRGDSSMIILGPMMDRNRASERASERANERASRLLHAPPPSRAYLSVFLSHHARTRVTIRLSKYVLSIPVVRLPSF